MVLGIITTKHIIAHPVVLIRSIGFCGYLFMLRKSLDHQPHSFVELMFKNMSKNTKTEKDRKRTELVTK